jgi:hypothetical protein
MSVEDEERVMHQRRITLPDGRYLIFYTFEEEATAPAASDLEAGARQPETEPSTDAEEERRTH